MIEITLSPAAIQSYFPIVQLNARKNNKKIISFRVFQCAHSAIIIMEILHISSPEC